MPLAHRRRSAGTQLAFAQGDPYDNARAESFMKTLKYEEVCHNGWCHIFEAQSSIGRFLEQVHKRVALASGRQAILHRWSANNCLPRAGEKSQRQRKDG